MSILMMILKNAVSQQPCWPWAAASVTLRDGSTPCTGHRFSRRHLFVWLPLVTMAKGLISWCQLALQPLA